jgi:penicillin-binding protein 1C
MKRQYLKYGAVVVAGLILLLWLFCLPRNLFEGVSYSTVVTDKNGALLGARVADDGQWRFPPCDTLPEKFLKALIEFEDHRFYAHCGVSATAIGRAIVQNIRNGRVVSGGSTLSMQVIRLSRQKPRTVWQKIVEMFMATRLEARYSKEEILRIYASHAPFGGNVVGIDAALWRYLGNDGAELSWAEAATLAVLQNAPSLIHLDKNRDALLAKRNRLLTRLYEKGELSDDDYELAVEEPLIGEPYPMPQYAPHLVEHYHKTAHGALTTTALELSLQRRVEELATRWSKELRGQNIRDIAVVISEVESGDVIAYCGNSDMSFERDGKWVDIARSPRSSGSVLKPLLYAAALQEGVILPNSLLPDVPTDFGGFVPKNFDGSYAGAIAADEALALSLNIPNVYLLKEYGVARFAETLQQVGFSSLTRPTDEYGLSLVLGGAEVRLVDVVSCYSSMARCYADSLACVGFPLNDKVALHYTFNAMREVNRPDQMDWRRASSVQNVAWKTGTSYGSRDAWAVGVTPKYVVGIWVGNADGSGVPELTGARTAGPILFDMFNLLPHSEWFTEPDASDGVMLRVCTHSGHLAGRHCTDTKELLLPAKSIDSPRCPYCKEVSVSLDGLRLVGDRSEPTRPQCFFVLPPLMEHYYRQQHQEYHPLPKKSATNTDIEQSFHFVYPADGSIVSIPKQMDGTKGSIVCQAVHNSSAELFWHLDGAYIGTTSDLHKMQIKPSLGYHTITVVDDLGAQKTISIIVK